MHAITQLTTKFNFLLPFVTGLQTYKPKREGWLREWVEFNIQTDTNRWFWRWKVERTKGKSAQYNAASSGRRCKTTS